MSGSNLDWSSCRHCCHCCNCPVSCPLRHPEIILLLLHKPEFLTQLILSILAELFCQPKQMLKWVHVPGGVPVALVLLLPPDGIVHAVLLLPDAVRAVLLFRRRPCFQIQIGTWNLALLWDDDVLILCSREMRECDFMLTRSDTEAGQPVALIMTRTSQYKFAPQRKKSISGDGAQALCRAQMRSDEHV